VGASTSQRQSGSRLLIQLTSPGSRSRDNSTYPEQSQTTRSSSEDIRVKLRSAGQPTRQISSPSFLSHRRLQKQGFRAPRPRSTAASQYDVHVPYTRQIVRHRTQLHLAICALQSTIRGCRSTGAFLCTVSFISSSGILGSVRLIPLWRGHDRGHGLNMEAVMRLFASPYDVHDHWTQTLNVITGRLELSARIGKPAAARCSSFISHNICSLAPCCVTYMLPRALDPSASHRIRRPRYAGPHGQGRPRPS